MSAADAPAERPPDVFPPEEIRAFVSEFLDRREAFLRTAGRHGSPLYVMEPAVLRQRAERFTAAFRRHLPDVRVYFAMKSNNLPAVARTLVSAGLGLDVSSGRELLAALDCGAEDIIFSGPGKTDAELALAVENAARTTVLMDSRGELERLERIAAGRGARVRAGVRLTTDGRGLWRKFGIALEDLGAFLDAAGACDHVLLRGLQFHTSWNMDPSAQVKFLAKLGAALAGLSPAQRAMIEFVDVGGGFWPERGEWLHGKRAPDPFSLRHYRVPSQPIEVFAEQIGLAVRAHLFPHVSCRICAEPGRWLCHDGLHLLLTVVDRKAADLVITDGGTNAVGWERFETDYFPVINLSRPALTERPCHVLGSLCTPHDVWGFAYWGADIQPGDVLLIPTQGAYTYSLRQDFIKPLPAVAEMDETA